MFLDEIRSRSSWESGPHGNRDRQSSLELLFELFSRPSPTSGDLWTGSNWSTQQEQHVFSLSA